MAPGDYFRKSFDTEDHRAASVAPSVRSSAYAIVPPSAPHDLRIVRGCPEEPVSGNSAQRTKQQWKGRHLEALGNRRRDERSLTPWIADTSRELRSSRSNPSLVKDLARPLRSHGEVEGPRRSAGA